MVDENKQLAVIPQITEVMGIVPKLIVAGNIKVGGKGETKTSSKGNDFQLPIRFNHFKLTTTERGPDGNLIENIELTDAIKLNGGILNKDGNLVGIPVMFMWDDNALNFPYRRACYVGGKLVCQGNGEEAYSMMDNFTQPKKCPCHKGAVGYSKNDKCKFHGKLTVVIEASQLFGQVYKFTTTSENSIKGILAGIALIKKLTKNRIAGLPLMLTFNNLSTITPTGQNTTVPVVGICFRGSMFDMRKQCIQLFEQDAEFENDMKLLEESAREAGEGQLFDDEKEEQEMVEEYFPDKDSSSSDVIDVESSEVVEKLEPVDSGDKNLNDVTGETGQEKETHQEETVQSEAKKVDPAKVELFERLQGQSDPVKALALAKRNDKPHLIKYFKRYVPNNVLDPKSQKPVFIAAFEAFIQTEEWKQAVADYTSGKFIEKPVDKVSVDEQKPAVETTQAENNNVDPLIIAIAKTDDRTEIFKLIEARFPNKPINRTLVPTELIDLAKRWLADELKSPVNTAVKKDSIVITPKDDLKEKEAISQDNGPSSEDPTGDKEKDPRYFALEGEEQVVRETITEIIQLKKKISDLNDKEKWFDFVAEFVDLQGEYVVSAKLLTQKQADFLAVLLQMKIDGVPF